MQIPVWLIRAKNAHLEWVNVTVYERGRIELRRIDMIVAGGFIAATGWYWMLGGWKYALLGGLTYILLAMIALWF